MRIRPHLPAAALVALLLGILFALPPTKAPKLHRLRSGTGTHSAAKPLESQGFEPGSELARLDRSTSLPFSRDPRSASIVEGSPYSGPEWDEMPEEARALFLAQSLPGAGQPNAAVGAVNPPAAGAEPAHVCLPELLETGHTEPNGTIPYTADVQKDGEPEVVVPIQVPRGVRGLQPNLSLVYNGPGFGIAGRGWHLSGLSAISRIPKSWASNGVLAPVSMTDADDFALDGNRLVPIGGGLYRTEQDEFAKIEALGNPNENGFKVWRRDGLIYSYGTTDVSRFGKTAGKGHTWACNRIEDRTGNKVELRYWRGRQGEWNPQALEYGIEEILWANGTRRVEFEYEIGRPDAVYGARDGLRAERTRLLKWIHVYTGSGPSEKSVRKYELYHEPDPLTNDPLLKEIREYGSDNVRKRPLTFVYEARERGFSVPAGQAFTLTNGNRPINNHWNELIHALSAGDLDGDGRDDLLYFEKSPQGRTLLQCRFSSGGAAREVHGWSPSPEDPDPVWNGRIENYSDAMALRPQPLDYNRVGKDGLLLLRHRTIDEDAFKEIVVVAFSDIQDPGGQFFVQETGIFLPVRDGTFETPVVADIDGDGYKDLLYMESEDDRRCVVYHRYDGNRFGPANRAENIVVQHWSRRNFTQWNDVDGDGAIDLVLFQTSGNETFAWWARFVDAFHADGTEDPRRIDWRGLATIPHPHARVAPFFLDVDGDGNTDLAYWLDEGQSVSLRVMRNWGRAAFEAPYEAYRSAQLRAAPGSVPHSTPAILDFDRDGKMDILPVSYYTQAVHPVNADAEPCLPVNDPGTSILLRSDGRTFIERPVAIPPYMTTADGVPFAAMYATRLVMDANGDGADDVVAWHGGTGSPIPAVYTQRIGPSGRLIDVRDGNGATTRFEYRQLYDVERGQGQCEYPLTWTSPRRRVISRLHVEHHPGEFRAFTYGYFNGQSHPRGMKGLGFEYRTTLDDLTGNKTSIQTVRRRLEEMETYVAESEFRVDESRVERNGAQIYHRVITHEARTPRILNHAAGRTYAVVPQASVVAYATDRDPYDFRRPMTLPITYESPGVYFLRGTDYSYPPGADFFGKPSGIDTWTHVQDFGAVPAPPSQYWSHQNTTFVFQNDTERWLLALPRYRYDHAETAALAYPRRTTEYTYVPETGLLETEKIEPNSDEFEVLTRYHRADPFGNVTSITQSARRGGARETHVTYDADGIFPEQTVNAMGHRTHVCWHPGFGLPVRTELPGGLVTTIKYDGFGRVLEERRPDGTKSEQTYGSAPNVLIVTQKERSSDGTEGGEVSRQYFDFRNRLIYSRHRLRERNTKWSVTDYAYDGAGRMVGASLPRYEGSTAQQVRYTYDALGRVTRIDHPDGESVRHAYDLFTVVTTHRDGNVTKAVNGPSGPLVSVDPENGRTSYEYDGWGQLVTIIDRTELEANKIKHFYDLWGRRWKSIDPSLGTIFHYFDGYGRLTRQLHGGKTTRLERDALGRIYQRIPPEAVVGGRVREADTARWVYDTDGNRTVPGRLLKKSFKDTSTVYEYDPLGRVTRSTTAIGQRQFVFNTSYNEKWGGPDILTCPAGPADPDGKPFAVKYGYRSYGQLGTVTDANTGAKYWALDLVDARDRIRKETFGEDLVTSREFWPIHGGLKRIRTGRNDGVQHLSYEYDPETLDLKVRHDFTQASHEEFEYDALNRLTKWTLAGPGIQLDPQVYGYDALGNLTAKTDVGAIEYLDPGHPHRITRALGQNFAYDARGNLRTGAGYTADWTSFNKPSRITRDGKSTNLFYDADFQRIKKVTPAGTTIYVEGLFELFEGSDGTRQARYFVQGPERLVMQVVRANGNVPEEKWYLHDDHVGSIVAMTNASTREVRRLFYDPFGRRRQADGSPLDGAAGGNPGFTGHEHDDELGLINMKGRIQDPRLGRFLSPDPFLPSVPTGQEINRYSYVLNNPMRHTDPSGYLFADIWKAITNAGEWFGENVLGFGNDRTSQLDTEDRRAREFYDRFALDDDSEENVRDPSYQPPPIPDYTPPAQDGGGGRTNRGDGAGTRATPTTPILATRGARPRPMGLYTGIGPNAPYMLKNMGLDEFANPNYRPAMDRLTSVGRAASGGIEGRPIVIAVNSPDGGVKIGPFSRVFRNLPWRNPTRTIFPELAAYGLGRAAGALSILGSVIGFATDYQVAKDIHENEPLLETKMLREYYRYRYIGPESGVPSEYRNDWAWEHLLR